MTAWAHLPNAKVIDELIADAFTRAPGWIAARNALWGPWWSAKWGRIYGVDHEDWWGQALDAAQQISEDTVDIARATQIIMEEVTGEVAVWGAAVALFVWPSSSYLLALPPEAVHEIIDTCDGDVKHQAVLLLPAVIARSTP